ncbi:hypothetical protein TorRG33x02_295520, partial [Trema orientale]
ITSPIGKCAFSLSRRVSHFHLTFALKSL